MRTKTLQGSCHRFDVQAVVWVNTFLTLGTRWLARGSKYSPGPQKPNIYPRLQLPATNTFSMLLWLRDARLQLSVLPPGPHHVIHGPAAARKKQQNRTKIFVQKGLKKSPLSCFWTLSSFGCDLQDILLIYCCHSNWQTHIPTHTYPQPQAHSPRFLLFLFRRTSDRALLAIALQ